MSTIICTYPQFSYHPAYLSLILNIPQSAHPSFFINLELIQSHMELNLTCLLFLFVVFVIGSLRDRYGEYLASWGYVNAMGARESEGCAG